VQSCSTLSQQETGASSLTGSIGKDVQGNLMRCSSKYKGLLFLKDRLPTSAGSSADSTCRLKT
jgi:hypothetical protein